MYDFAFFDKPIDRRGTSCEKWDMLMEREGRELLPMWVADMDFRCADEIVSALQKRAAHPVYGYTEQSSEAVEALLGFLKRRHGLTLTAEQQLLLPCVVTGLKAAVRAFTKPGDRVIVQSPVYGPFFLSTELNGRVLADSPLKRGADGRYAMDFDGLETQCRAGARLMLLCNPHNPASRAWTKDELTRLWTLLKRYDVLLVSDEIHADFVYEQGGYTSCLNIATGANDRAIVLTSASKTFNIAGLQQAALLTRNQALKAAMNDEMNASGVTSGNIFALAATEAAYRFGDAWLDGLLAYLRKGREILAEELTARLPEAKLTPLEATYLGWIDLRAYGMDNAALMKRTHECGVAFTDGAFFGKEQGEGFLRINIGCPHASVREAVRRLEKAVKG